MNNTPPLPSRALIEDDVRRALAEDIGSGDLTAQLVADALARAELVTREDAVLCGTAWFDEVFRQLDARVRVTWLKHDGDRVPADAVLCRLDGPARALLSGERSALNFLQTLSGTATVTRQYADAMQIVLLAASFMGRDLAPRVAVRLGAGLATDCTELELDATVVKVTEAARHLRRRAS